MKKNFCKALALVLTASMLTACGAASGTPTATKTESSTDTASNTAPETTDATSTNYDDVEPEITLTLSHQMAENHSINTTAEYFANLVKEKSKGKIAVDVYPSATLGTETENLQALTNGTLDMAIIACEFYANYVNEAGIFCLPYMYDSYDDCYDKLEGEAGDKVAKLVLDQTNVRILDYYVLAFRQIFTADKEINSVNDMSGLIIRIPDSTTYKTTFSQLGASPTAVAWGETYTALDTGVVSAVENTPESIMSASMQEVCKYVNVTNHLIAPTTISISDSVYSKLTQEQQQIISEAAAEACEYGKNLTADNSDANFEALKGAGLTVVETDTESMKNSINYDDYDCAKTDAGKEILSLLGK
ncbi:MAG: TRAP transporter substrate-binding protein [Velocimicrobium sp.]